jgi:hypothetical protein
VASFLDTDIPALARRRSGPAAAAAPIPQRNPANEEHARTLEDATRSLDACRRELRGWAKAAGWALSAVAAAGPAAASDPGAAAPPSASKAAPGSASKRRAAAEASAAAEAAAASALRGESAVAPLLDAIHALLQRHGTGDSAADSDAADAASPTGAQERKRRRLSAIAEGDEEGGDREKDAPVDEAEEEEAVALALASRYASATDADSLLPSTLPGAFFAVDAIAGALRTSAASIQRADELTARISRALRDSAFAGLPGVAGVTAPAVPAAPTTRPGGRALLRGFLGAAEAVASSASSAPMDPFAFSEPVAPAAAPSSPASAAAVARVMQLAQEADAAAARGTTPLKAKSPRGVITAPSAQKRAADAVQSLEENAALGDLARPSVPVLTPRIIKQIKKGGNAKK